MYPVFEPGQKIFPHGPENDWESLDKAVWVCLLSNSTTMAVLVLTFLVILLFQQQKPLLSCLCI